MAGPVPRRRRGRILVSLIQLLVLVSTLPLLLLSWHLVSTAWEHLELDQKHIQQAKAKSLSQQVATYLRSVQAQLEPIARMIEVDTVPGRFGERLDRIRESKALERYFEDTTSSMYYLSVVDTSCIGVKGSGIDFHDPSVQESLREGCNRGIRGESMVSPPVVASSLREPVIVLAEPVSPRGAPVQGVVLGVASFLPVWNMTEQLGKEGLGDVYVINERGELVAHSDPAKLQGDRDVSGLEIVRRFRASRGQTTTEPFMEGSTKMLGTYARVPDDSGWGVIVQVEDAKAYYGAYRMRAYATGVLVLVTIAVFVLGVFFAGQVTKPIQELARGARRLAGGDYASRVKVRTDNEVGLLADAFNHMGDEIQKAIEQIQQAAATNKELFMGSIRMLANAIDEKDPYTRGHSERVAYYSMVIAKHMGMPPDEVEKVYLSGLIHDVGKIGIEDKILRKAAALTDEEYEIMKQHPKKGEHILEAVPLLKQMAGAGLMHHENVDGSGYPESLRGDQIPLLGRIVSVADAFDAMTTDRPYSKAMTFEAALARLRFLVDKKFDGGCVTAMEKAAAAGDLTPAKARHASVMARQAAVG